MAESKLTEPITNLQPEMPPINPEKRKSGLIIILIALLIISLGMAGYLAYQNFQLRQQVAQAPAPETSEAGPSPTQDEIPNWKTYRSDWFEISLQYPQDDVLDKPHLSADLGINYSGNKLVNSELQDGYKIHIGFAAISAKTLSPKEAAKKRRDYESENCTISDISTLEVGQREAYSFQSTDCFSGSNLDTLYFVKGINHQYYITASHKGDVAKYQEITKKIVESIKFHKSDCTHEILGISVAPPSTDWSCRVYDGGEENTSLLIDSALFTIQISNLGRGPHCVDGADSCQVTSFYTNDELSLSLYNYEGKDVEIFGGLTKANENRPTDKVWLSATYKDMEKRKLTEAEKNQLIELLDSISSN